MQVSAPFTLRETDPATAQQIEQGLREDPATRSVAVREVVAADGSVSVFMAADASLRNGDIAEIATGDAGELRHRPHLRNDRRA